GSDSRPALPMRNPAAPLMGGNDAGRLSHIGRGEMRLANPRQPPFAFIPIVDQDRSATGAPSGFDVIENIPDDPRASEVNAVLAGGRCDHSRPWFAAFAFAGIVCDAALRMLRAGREAGDRNIPRCEKLADSLVDCLEGWLRKVAKRHAGLVRGDDETIT